MTNPDNGVTASDTEPVATWSQWPYPVEGGSEPDMVNMSMPVTADRINATQGTSFSGTIATFNAPAYSSTIFSANVNWGDDGAGSGGPVTVVPNGSGGYNVNASHTYIAAGDYEVTTIVLEELPTGNPFGPPDILHNWQATSSALVAGAALTGTANNLSATAGSSTGLESVATFTDAFTAYSSIDFVGLIDWGDGTDSDAGTIIAGGSGSFTVIDEHTYAHPGVYKTSVLITDPGDMFALVHGTTTVATTPSTSGTLTGSGTTVSGTEATFLTGVQVASFSDSNLAGGPYSATISWGDFQSSPGTVVSLGSGNFKVTGSHNFSTWGSFATSVTITTGGTTLTVYSMALINNAAIALTLQDRNTGDHAPVINMEVASFTYANKAAPASAFAARIDWGDGTSSAGLVMGSNGLFYVTGSHEFPSLSWDDQLITQVTIYSILGDGFTYGFGQPTGIIIDQAHENVDAAESSVGLDTTPDLFMYWSPNSLDPTPFNEIPNWGEEPLSTPPPGYNWLPAGWSSSAGNNVYSNAGNYTVTRVYEGNFASDIVATYTEPNYVAPALPGISSTTPLVLANLGAPIESIGDENASHAGIALATFFSLDPNATLAQFKAYVDWGDGTPQSLCVISYQNGVFLVTGYHTYHSEGDFTILVKVYYSSESYPDTVGATHAVVSADGIIYQREVGTLLDIGASPSQDGGQVTVAPNTGTLQVYQPLDPRLSHDASTDGFIDVNGNPLQGQTSGDGRLLDMPTGATSGPNTFDALVYSSDRVNPRPIAEAYASFDPGFGVPYEIEVSLTWNGGSPQTTVDYTVSSTDQPGATYLIGDQVASVVTASGAYPWTMTAEALYSGRGSQTLDFAGTALVDNENASPFGACWTLHGLNHLVVQSDGVLMLFGSGATPMWYPLDSSGNFPAYDSQFGTLAPVTGGYTYTSKYGIVWHFNSSGDMTSITDPHNLAATFTYSGGEPVGLAWPDGAVTTFSYSGSLIAAIQEPGSRTLSLTQGANLTGITDVDGTSRSFGYDANHHLTSLNWAPLLATYTYDSTSGVLTGVNDGLGTTYTLRPSNVVVLQSRGSAVSPEAAVAQWTDALFNRNIYTLDVPGWVTELVTPDGYQQLWFRDTTDNVAAYFDQDFHYTQYTYDNSTLGKGDQIAVSYAGVSSEEFGYENILHRMTSSTDGNGNTTRYSYNANSDLTAIQDPTGAITTYAWSSAGLETSVMDADGNTTKYQYQSAPSRLLVDTIDPLLDRTTYAYDARGFQTGVQNARGYWTTTTYDARGRALLQHNPDGGLISMGYDAIGDMISYQDASPLQHPIGYSFDQRGLLTAVADNWGGTSRMAYDVAKNLTSTADQLNHATTYAYYVVNRQITVRDPMNAVSTTVYDPAGNVIATIDPDNHVTYYKYDSLNQQTSVQDANFNYTTTTYDAAGHVLSVENADLESTYYAYDADNRLTLETDATTHFMGTRYDLAGNVTTSIDDLGDRTTYSYDQDERQTRVLDPMGDVNTTMYDADGNVTVTINPDLDRVTYTYDPMDREQTVEDPDLGVTTTTYDLAGNVLSVEDPRTGITTYTTDPINHLSVIENALTGLATTYYDITGNVASATDANGDIAFGSYRDSDGRVTASMDPGWQPTDYYYDPQGNVTAVIDTHGNTTTYAYDPLNRLTLTIHPLGDTEQTFYDKIGNVTATKDGLNLTTYYAYDQDNRQTLVTHPLGDTEATHYDADDNMTSETDGNGHTTTYLYDQDGRQTTVQDALGGLTTISYDDAGNVTMITDALGHSTHYQYNSSGQQTAVIDARGAITTTTFDLAGNVLTVTDPLLHVVTSSYDALDRLTSQTDGAGHTIQTFYDPTSRETATVDGRGYTWHTAYSSALFYALFGVSQTDPLGNSVGRAYYSDGEYVAYGDPLEREPGATANGYYDADQRLTHWNDEHGRGTSMQYDADSRLTAEQITDLWATYTYDNDGRVLTEKGPLVAGASYAYDAASNVTSETNAQAEITTYLCDALNRVTVEQQPLGETVTTTYDAVGNVLSIEDGDDNVTTFAYNQVNEKTSSTDANGHVTLWAYDLAGQVTSTTDADGRTIKTSFDGDGNVTSETWLAADGTTVLDTLTYQYDADENLTLASNNAGTYTMSYDAADRLTFEAEPFRASVTYSYDGMGDITLQQDSFGGLMSMMYDPVQELNDIQFSQGGAVSEQLSGFIDYNIDGSFTLIGGFTDAAETHQAYQQGFEDGPGGQRSGDASYNMYAGGAMITENLYGYASDGGAHDGQGQLTSLATFGGSTTTYSYDGAGQLTGSQNSVYGNLTYSYDAAGNSAATGTTIGADNQISTDGVWTYYYDAVGDRIKKINVADGNAWTYDYNDANQLVTVEHFSTSSGGVPTGSPTLVENFTYDVFGNRLSDTLTQSGSTTVTRFAYDQNGNAWADLNSSNQLVTRRIYLQGVDQLFARIDAGTGHAYFYITDPNNTVDDIIDANTGSVVDAYAYDAYGNILNQTGPSYGDRYGYDGREFDSATGLYYNRARYYDPVTRTFTSPDPAQADPLGNTYRFVGNDPMDGSDPEGTQDTKAESNARLQAAVLKLDRDSRELALIRFQQDNIGGGTQVNKAKRYGAAAVISILSASTPTSSYHTGPIMRARTPADDRAMELYEERLKEQEASERSAASFQLSLSAMNPTYKPDWDMIERVRQRRVADDARAFAKLSFTQQVICEVLEQAIWLVALDGLGAFAKLTSVGKGISGAELGQFVKRNPQVVESELVGAYESQTGKLLSFSERDLLRNALKESLPTVETEQVAARSRSTSIAWTFRKLLAAIPRCVWAATPNGNSSRSCGTGSGWTRPSST